MKKPFLIIIISFFACLSLFVFGGTINAEADEVEKRLRDKEIDYITGSGDLIFSVAEYGLTGITVVWKEDPNPTTVIEPLAYFRCQVNGDTITLTAIFLESLINGDVTYERESEIRLNVYGYDINDGKKAEIPLFIFFKVESDDDTDPNENGGDEDGGDDIDKDDNDDDTTDDKDTQEPDGEIGGGNTALPKRTPNSTIGCNAAPFIFLPLALIGIIKKKS